MRRTFDFDDLSEIVKTARQNIINTNCKKDYISKKSSKKSTNRVSHPNHYMLPNGIECIDVIKYFNWNIGSAIKYCWRNGKKQEEGMTSVEKQIQDLEKAIECIKFEINMLKENNKKV